MQSNMFILLYIKKIIFLFIFFIYNKMSSQTVYFNNPADITNLQRQVLPQSSQFGTNHLNNMQEFVGTLRGSGTSAFKGVFAHYGNAFTNQTYFVTTGAAGSDGRVYTPDTKFWFASNNKVYTQACFAKMVEEGYTNSSEKLSKYISWLSGAAYYYHRIFASPTQASWAGFTGAVPVGAPYTGAGDLSPFYGGSSFDTINPEDPRTYVYQLATTNLATFGIEILLSFNWPMLYPYLVFGSNGSALCWSDSGFSGQSTLYTSNNFLTKAPSSSYQILGAGSALTYQKWRDWYFINGTGAALVNDGIHQDVFFNAHAGLNVDLSKSSLQGTMENYVTLAKDGTCPLLWNPSSRILDNYYYGVETIPQIYGTSDEMLGIVMDAIMKSSSNLKGAAYPGGLFKYMEDKITTPLGIPRSDYKFLLAENCEFYPAANHPEFSLRRTVALATTGGAGFQTGAGLLTKVGGNYLGASWSCSPSYITNGKVGQTVWASEHPDDGLLVANFLKLNGTGSNISVLGGGSPFGTMPIKHLPKIHICLANNGYYNGVQILKPSSVRWLLSNHANAMSITYFSGQYSAIGPNSLVSSSMSFNGGLARFNTDLCVAPLPFVSDSIYFWGGVGGSYLAIDMKSGLWVLLGTQMYTGSNYTATLPFGGSVVGFRGIYGALLALQKMQQ